MIDFSHSSIRAVSRASSPSPRRAGALSAPLDRAAVLCSPAVTDPASELASDLVPRTPAPSRRRPTRDGLSARSRANARALAEGLWSRDGESAPPLDRLAYFETDLSDFVGHLNTRARLLFLVCLGAITWIAPLAIGRLGRLGSLSIGERIRAICALERTPASLALVAVKAITSIVWFEHPDTAREIGWDQRCLGARR